MRVPIDIPTLSRGLHAVAPAMGGKYPYMLIDAREGELRFIASDGHWMSCWTCGGAKVPESVQVGVDGASLLALLPSLARFAESETHPGAILLGKPAGYAEDRPDPVRIEHSLGAVTISGCPLSCIPFVDHYEKYTHPPEVGPPTAWLGASAKYLGDVVRVFQRAGPNASPNLVIRNGSEREPLYVTSLEVPSLRVVLMPVLTEGRIPPRPLTRGDVSATVE